MTINELVKLTTLWTTEPWLADNKKQLVLFFSILIYSAWQELSRMLIG